jgi:2-isopropylmalate synthase
MAEKSILISDTTLREGGQSMATTLIPIDMLAIAEKLHEFGVPWIEGPWPVPEDETKEEEEEEARQKATEFYQLVKAVPFRDKIVVFGSTMEKEVEAKQSKRLKSLVQTGVKNFAIFGKTSKRHVFEVLKTTLKENLRMIEESVRFLKRKSGTVFYDAEHFFDGFLEDREYALKTLEAAKAGGADAIILCDTNGGMLPEQVIEIILQALPIFGNTAWGVHMHDDGELALANTLCAINYGATYAQVTVNGESERVGMPKITSLVPTLIHKKGIKCQGIASTKGLKALAEFVAERNNNYLPDSRAYVGEWAFTHSAGTHQAGAKVDPSLQEHINPDLVGSRRRYPISGEVGRKAVAAALSELNIKLEADDPVVRKILSKVRALDKKGLHLESAPGSFALLALRQLVDYKPPFRVTVIKPMSTLVKEDGPWKHRSRAEIEVFLPNQEEPLRLWARGKKGPLDSIDNALRPALLPSYPQLEDVSLIDYKVRKLPGNGKGTAAKVRVAIIGSTPYGYEVTAGMSENLLLASAEALIELYELVILKSQRQN